MDKNYGQVGMIGYLDPPDWSSASLISSMKFLSVFATDPRWLGSYRTLILSQIDRHEFGS